MACLRLGNLAGLIRTEHVLDHRFGGASDAWDRKGGPFVQISKK